MNRGMVLAGATVLGSGVLMKGSGPSRSVLTLPMNVKEGQTAHRRRRGENGRLELLQEIQLKPGFGTHFVYIYVGTPPQRVSVIVDTGSRYTAFPCSECHNCGARHTDAHWSRQKSSTYVSPSCQEKQEKCSEAFKCNETSDKCFVVQSYQEGSSWDAFEVTDKVYMGQELPGDTHNLLKPINFTFGCIYSEAKPFRMQRADGIMGMNGQKGTFIHALKESGAIDSDMFSICYHREGGTLVLGGFEPELWEKPNRMAYAIDYGRSKTSHKVSFFRVKVVDIKIGDRKLQNSIGSDSLFKSIVDSGTTDTYLPYSIEPKFKKIWEELTGMEYKTENLQLSEDAVAALPPITFIIKGENDDVEVEMFSDAYLTKTKGGYDASILFDLSGGTILGSNFMQNHDVLFDIENSRIGFARANCKYRDLQDEKSTPSDPMKCTIKNEPVQKTSCNVTCPRGNRHSTTYLMGYEEWIDQYADGADPNCKPLEPELRPCVMRCGTGSTLLNDCNILTWLSCDLRCKQVKLAKKEGSGCAKVEERECATGVLCKEAEKGVIVKYVLHFSTVSKTCEYYNDKLEVRNNLVLPIANFFGVLDGDIELERANNSTNGDLNGCQLLIIVHFHHEKGFDEQLASAVKMNNRVKSPEGKDALIRDLRQVLDGEVKDMTLFGIYSASTGDAVHGSESHWGTALFFVFFAIVTIGAVFFGVKRLNRSGAEYHPMSHGSGMDDDETLEEFSPEPGQGIQLQGSFQESDSDSICSP